VPGRTNERSELLVRHLEPVDRKHRNRNAVYRRFRWLSGFRAHEEVSARNLNHGHGACRPTMSPPGAPRIEIVAEPLAGQRGQRPDEITVEPRRLAGRTEASDERRERGLVILTDDGRCPRCRRRRLEIFLRTVRGGAPGGREQRQRYAAPPYGRQRPEEVPARDFRRRLAQRAAE
jgi:hypothetical protein